MFPCAGWLLVWCATRWRPRRKTTMIITFSLQPARDQARPKVIQSRDFAVLSQVAVPADRGDPSALPLPFERWIDHSLRSLPANIRHVAGVLLVHFECASSHPITIASRQSGKLFDFLTMSRHCYSIIKQFDGHARGFWHHCLEPGSADRRPSTSTLLPPRAGRDQRSRSWTTTGQIATAPVGFSSSCYPAPRVAGARPWLATMRAIRP